MQLYIVVKILAGIEKKKMIMSKAMHERHTKHNEPHKDLLVKKLCVLLFFFLPQNAPECISKYLKLMNFLGGHSPRVE